MAWQRQVGAALEYLERFTGGIVVPTIADVDVGITVVPLVQGDPERITIMFINLGTGNVFVSPDSVPSSAHGILLGPNGGIFAANVFQDGILPTLAWSAVSALGTQDVFTLTSRRDVRAPLEG